MKVAVGTYVRNRPFVRDRVDDRARGSEGVAAVLVSIYIMAAPLDFVSILPGTSVPKLVVVFPLLAVFVRMTQTRVRDISAVLALSGYLCWLIVATVFSVDQNASVSRFTTIALNVAVVILVGSLALGPRGMRVIERALISTGWVTLVLMFVSGGVVGGERRTVELAGQAQDPNYLGGYLIFGIVAYYSRYQQHRRPLWIVLMLVQFSGLLLTGSRGAFLAAVAALVAYSVISISSSKRGLQAVIMNLFSIFLIVPAISFALSIMPASISERFTSEFSESDRAANRIDIWSDLFAWFSDSTLARQIVGWGPGTVAAFNERQQVAHNVFIEALIESGIVGLVTILMVYGVYFARAVRCRNFVAAATLIGYFTMSLSMSLYSYKLLWIMMSIVLLNISGDRKSQSALYGHPGSLGIAWKMGSRAAQ